MRGSHNFTQLPAVQRPRSKFNLSCEYKTTLNGGQLIPIFCEPVYPGDTFNVKANYLARLVSCQVPFMDSIRLETEFFFVPYRLVWDHWEEFNGAQVNPGDPTDFVLPTISSPSGGWPFLSMADYLGIRPGDFTITVNALPFRAMKLIWNEWYRDENLQDSFVINLGDGPDTDQGDYVTPFFRNKTHDYITSCLPFPQKGPAVELPLGTTANIILNPTTGISPIARQASSHAAWTGGGNWSQDAAGLMYLDSGTGPYGVFDPNGSLYADLSTATGPTINAMRQAIVIQQMYELDARGGTRYTEILRSHWGVIAPDYRLQRPEYLGGGISPVKVNPVVQTSASVSGDTPQANLAAYGVSVDHRSHGFVKSFDEHGVVIGFASIRQNLTYQYGVNRHWFYSTRFDLPDPLLMHLGEQAVLSQEIYANGTGEDRIAFGYQERWAECRSKMSLITGIFRSDAPSSLDVWHLAEKFIAAPLLNNTFIADPSGTDLQRVVAVNLTDSPQFYLDCYFNFTAARVMPVYSTPGLRRL